MRDMRDDDVKICTGLYSDAAYKILDMLVKCDAAVSPVFDYITLERDFNNEACLFVYRKSDRYFGKNSRSLDDIIVQRLMAASSRLSDKYVWKQGFRKSDISAVLEWMKSGQKKTLKSVNLKGLVGMPLDPFAAEAKRIEAEEAEKQRRTRKLQRNGSRWSICS